MRASRGINNDQEDDDQQEDDDGSELGTESRAVVAADGKEETGVLLQTETHTVSRMAPACPAKSSTSSDLAVCASIASGFAE